MLSREILERFCQNLAEVLSNFRMQKENGLTASELFWLQSENFCVE